MTALSVAHRRARVRRPSRPPARNVGRPARELLKWRRDFLEFGPPQATARLVLLVIATYMGSDGGADGKAFPAFKTIAKCACITPRAALAHVRALVESGWLVRRARRRTRSRSPDSNSYIAAYPPGFDIEKLTGRKVPTY